MYRFAHRVPFDLTPYVPPPPTDRTGPPLSQGIVLTLILTRMTAYCAPTTRAILPLIDPHAWYHGQVLESILNELEDCDPALPHAAGHMIYYTLRYEFAELGIATLTDLMAIWPSLWYQVTRGDSGEWRTTIIAPGRVQLELLQPYNCQFEHGTVHGALECYGAQDIEIQHTRCRRTGARACVLEVAWDTPDVRAVSG